LEDKVEFGEQPSDIGKFLGGMRDFKKGRESTLIVNTRDFLASAVQRYKDEIGVKQLPRVRIPYLMEDFVAKGKEDAGAQAFTASSHLMKVLFAARLCRPDLLIATARLAAKVSCWQLCHDRALRRLFGYIAHHGDWELIGALSVQDFETCKVWMYPDADLNGDLETSESMSGLWVEIRSADGLRCWPLACKSKRQGATATSTPEAETISMATGIRSEGIPMVDLFSYALGREVHRAASTTRQPSRPPWPGAPRRCVIWRARSASISARCMSCS